MWGRTVIGLISLTLFSISFIFVPSQFPVISTETSAIQSSFVARCDACHPSEVEEFSYTPIHNTLICVNCHIISEFNDDLYSHNATTFDCIFCHTDQDREYSNDSHMKQEKLCNGCHSHVKLEIKMDIYPGMNMSVSFINTSR